MFVFFVLNLMTAQSGTVQQFHVAKTNAGDSTVGVSICSNGFFVQVGVSRLTQFSSHKCDSFSSQILCAR